MKYCCHCGGALKYEVPAEDNLPRHVCGSCGRIHYVNPRIVVGVLPVHGEQVLMCRRAIEPRRNCWTLPAGFLENGESTVQGALREAWEEARAKICDQQLYRIYDLPHIDQVHMFFRGVLQDGKFAVGQESLEVQLFDEEDAPWDNLSFPVVEQTLRDYFRDRVRSEFPVRQLQVEQLYYYRRRNSVKP